MYKDHNKGLVGFCNTQGHGDFKFLCYIIGYYKYHMNHHYHVNDHKTDH